MRWLMPSFAERSIIIRLQRKRLYGLTGEAGLHSKTQVELQLSKYKNPQALLKFVLESVSWARELIFVLAKYTGDVHK